MGDSFEPSLNRRSLRLTGFDYSQAGAYFITMVTQGRACLFGVVIEGEMILNAAGEMVNQVCCEMPHFISNVAWGIYQIMPNHFHAIIELKNVRPTLPNLHVGADLCVCPGQPRRVAPTEGTQDAPIKLGDVVARFKSLTTRRYLAGVRNSNWPAFEMRLWQRNYYEHIIREERDYQSIFDYVVSNPQNWEKDREYHLK